MIRRRIVLIYWVFALTLFVPSAAYAYIDPATTTYIIQIITALIVTIGVSLSIFLYKFRMISAKIRYGLYGLAYRIKRRGKKPEREDSGETEASGHASGAGKRAEENRALPEFALPGAARPPSKEEMAAFASEDELARMEPSSLAGPGAGNTEPGKRRYLGRLRAALPTALALCLSFILIGCIDLAAQNTIDMPFKISEAVPVIVLCFAAAFVVLIFVIPLFRGSLFEIVVSLGLALLIAGYIQGNFLNMGLGELTGDEILWDTYGSKMAVSVVVWAAIVAAVFLLRSFARPLWRGMTVFVPFALVVIQGVALLPVLGEGLNAQSGTSSYIYADSPETLSVSGIDELADGKNAIVFLVDRLDKEFVDEIESMDPDFFEPLDGFTSFEDNISYYVSTFPSIAAMLTGEKFYFDGPVAPYFDKAWQDAKMMHEMKANGVDIKLYMPSGYTYSNIGQLEGIASNILVPEYGVSERILLVKLLKLSAFRYAPMPLKQSFWISPTEFNDAVELSAEASPFITNDFAIYDMLTTQRLKKNNEQSSFMFYYMHGAHDPIMMDENIQPSTDATPARQAMGAFKIIYEYIEQLKTLGLYDDATIIITGDHGRLHGDHVERPSLVGLFVKPAGSSGTPLAVSEAPVCPDQLAATVMEGLFDSAEGYGQSYFEVRESDPVTREYISDLKWYEIKGDGRDFENWEYIETLENKSDW